MKYMNEMKREWKTIAAGAFLLWTGWCSGMIVAHGIAIRELQSWRENRPRFATKEEVSLAVLESERGVREKLTAKLDQILDKLQAVDKKVGEHIAADNGLRKGI